VCRLHIGAGCISAVQAASLGLYQFDEYAIRFYDVISPFALPLHQGRRTQQNEHSLSAVCSLWEDDRWYSVKPGIAFVIDGALLLV
jgi:hypothetical protein